MNKYSYVLIVAKCIVNSNNNDKLIKYFLVLIVAKCIVNRGNVISNSLTVTY